MDTHDAFRDFAVGQTTSLRRLAFALCGDWHRADDLVQGALERAYVYRARVRAADDPGAYVRAILVRLAASEGRRVFRRREQLTDVVPDVRDERGGCEGAGDRIDLANALSGLTTRQRAVLVLRFLEDRSVSEVGMILGIGEGTVKRQTHDGLRRMRALLPVPNPDTASEVPHV